MTCTMSLLLCFVLILKQYRSVTISIGIQTNARYILRLALAFADEYLVKEGIQEHGIYASELVYKPGILPAVWSETDYLHVCFM